MEKYEINVTVNSEPSTFTLTIDKNLDTDAELFNNTIDGGIAIFSTRKPTTKECIADLLIFSEKNDIEFPSYYLEQIANERVYLMAKFLKE